MELEINNDLAFFEEEDIFSDEEYKLLVSIVKRGFETDVLEAAKSVGTTGAILLQGKGVSKTQRKFFGFNIDPENTVIMILVKNEFVVKTIKAVYAVSDFKSRANGIVFALPVSMVAGMDSSYDKIDLN